MIRIYRYHQLPSVFDIKIIFFDELFDNPNILFKIIVHYPQSDKVKLFSLYKFMPNDDTEEVVSTDIISV